MQKYLKITGYVLSVILILTLFLTFFHYFNIINEKIVEITKLIIPLIALFIGGYKVGKRSYKKGWLEGIKLGLFIVMIFIIFSLILRLGIDVRNILYYFILLVASMLGGMIGISRSEVHEEVNEQGAE